jgi:2-polyprenyl-6-methoxyphenol hydroxylase-like FAD-dependent oxidoreductase
MTNSKNGKEILVIGAGIGGLTLALTLHQAGLRCRVYEAASEIRPIGAGINILPHATRILSGLGLEAALSQAGVLTKDAAFYNRFGQLIYQEPLGRAAGYDWPQISIHRADLQDVLLQFVKSRLGENSVITGWQCTGSDQDESGAIAHFRDPATGAELPSQRAVAIIACDGIHSKLRKQFYPHETEPRYSGYNMWRGVTRHQPFLSGACMVRAGWLATGKMVIYPIRHNINVEGEQLINWVAELETPHYRRRDWNRPGNLNDFIKAFDDWKFDWLDVSALIRSTPNILEFPMVDQDPLPRWSFGRITLLGDAAHPMVPRGSNGAGQAILDAQSLAGCLAANEDVTQALKAYEDLRLEATTRVVLTNRSRPPDAILGEVYRRTGDKPFNKIEDVISLEELQAITEGYKQVAGYDQASLQKESKDP